MATPHVSGLAVLLASQSPELTHLELKERIMSTARPIKGLRGKVRTGGLIDAYAALTNATPQPDPNDPAKWAAVSVNVASAHPYADKAREEYEVSVPGANEIALYFSKFDTERTYDKLEIFDSTGKLVETISGRNDDSFSLPIKGSTAKLVFTSDASVSRWGFEITKAAYR